MKISNFNPLTKGIKASLAVFCTISLTACVTASPPVDKVVQVRLTHDNGTVSPEYQYREEIIIKGDLTTEWNRQEYSDQHQRHGKITPTQLQTLKDLIQQSHYMQVKIQNTLPMVGGSSGGIGIETNLGYRGFSGEKLPEGVNKVAGYARSLSPEWTPTEAHKYMLGWHDNDITITAPQNVLTPSPSK